MDDYDGPHRRHLEIQPGWPCIPEATRWVVLDDNIEAFPQDCHAHAVFTDPHLGLTPADIDTLRARLDRLLTT